MINYVDLKALKFDDYAFYITKFGQQPQSGEAAGALDIFGAFWGTGIKVGSECPFVASLFQAMAFYVNQSSMLKDSPEKDKQMFLSYMTIGALSVMCFLWELSSIEDGKKDS
jgi:hypothetical protein